MAPSSTTVDKSSSSGGGRPGGGGIIIQGRQAGWVTWLGGGKCTNSAFDLAWVRTGEGLEG